MLGCIYHELNDLTMAEHYSSKAYKLWPHPMIVNNYGEILRSNGKSPEILIPEWSESIENPVISKARQKQNNDGVKFKQVGEVDGVKIMVQEKPANREVQATILETKTTIFNKKFNKPKLDLELHKRGE